MDADWMVWIARLMFLGIFPIAWLLLRRAWRVGVRSELRYVVDWHGVALPDPARWARPWVLIHLGAGVCLLAVAAGVLVLGVSFEAWASLVALAIWTYYLLQHLLARRARHSG